MAKKPINEKKQAKKKSIRTKLLLLPITLVVLSTMALIGSVTYETYTGMRGQMREDNEFLLENVVSRLNDNTNSIAAIEGMVDGRLSESLEAVKNNDTKDMTQEEFIELAKLLQVDELNLFDINGEVINSSLSMNIGGQLESGHPILSFVTTDEEVM